MPRAPLRIQWRSSISIENQVDAPVYQNYFILEMTLYMFRTVFPSIIRSSGLYILQQEFVCCSTYHSELLMIDGKTVLNM